MANPFWRWVQHVPCQRGLRGAPQRSARVGSNGDDLRWTRSPDATELRHRSLAIRRWLADSETATGFDPAAGTELANARRMDADLGNPKSSQMGHWDVRQDRKEMGAGRHRAQFALFVWATVLLVLASLAS